MRPSRPSLLPPRLRLQEAGEREVERHAAWTELFFDPVFVACVAQLAAGLHDRPSRSPTPCCAWICSRSTHGRGAATARCAG